MQITANHDTLVMMILGTATLIAQNPHDLLGFNGNSHVKRNAGAYWRRQIGVEETPYRRKSAVTAICSCKFKRQFGFNRDNRAALLDSNAPICNLDAVGIEGDDGEYETRVYVAFAAKRKLFFINARNKLVSRTAVPSLSRKLSARAAHDYVRDACRLHFDIYVARRTGHVARLYTWHHRKNRPFVAKVLKIPCFDNAVVRHRADNQWPDGLMPQQGRPSTRNTMPYHALHEGVATGKSGAPRTYRGEFHAY